MRVEKTRSQIVYVADLAMRALGFIFQNNPVKAKLPDNPLSCRSCSSKIRPVLYDASPIPPMPGKSRAYFEAISLLPKHVGPVLRNGRCIGYMLGEKS